MRWIRCSRLYRALLSKRAIHRAVQGDRRVARRGQGRVRRQRDGVVIGLRAARRDVGSDSRGSRGVRRNARQGRCAAYRAAERRRAGAVHGQAEAAVEGRQE